ncbi:11361_t:CDS:1, partial [Dentiscutata heterogama]
SANPSTQLIHPNPFFYKKIKLTKLNWIITPNKAFGKISSIDNQ